MFWLQSLIVTHELLRAIEKPSTYDEERNKEFGVKITKHSFEATLSHYNLFCFENSIGKNLKISEDSMLYDVLEIKKEAKKYLQTRFNHGGEDE